ncbi:sigma-54-dependent Fis family transcriptional regulator [Fulvivirga sp. RKSG066]|uniref:sigma-54-dependent transcriptional regulator n=1 Tax=Fulvivirga aurantia TaxID=2529383 RepID=UPI0012BD57B3|nr:sigma-54 dependent transcriptional regulator [Fulvivirga aurantia]MTI21870.1 sigma-54-dependent Fis family transcriptional regulator [Fulvivirga aurantia]
MSKTPAKILIVDDDDLVLLSAQLLLEQHFTQVVKINNPQQIEEAFKEHTFDVVLLDMNFKQGETSGKEGIFWLKKIKEISQETNVLLMTAYGELDIAVEAMKEGASDFIVKPWQNEKLLATVQSTLRLTQQEKKVKQLEDKEKLLTAELNIKHEMIGESEAILEVKHMIEKVAGTDADVLILGENGTGKEVAARLLHGNSTRVSEPFISVDLGTIPTELFESELFGHKKGAFTDAKEARIGRFEAADGGTLFLDEIGNLPLNLQKKLLTVLQNRQITKVGTNEPTHVDVRVICATNGNLKEMVKQGEFREDLLYRINTVEILMPALKDRPRDIGLLADFFLKKYSSKYHKSGLALESSSIDKLTNYSWPGNVRELQHAIERAVIMSEGDKLTQEDFRFLQSGNNDNYNFDNYNLEHIEAWAIKKAIKKHNGNISHAAKELGLSRGAMYRRMDKYNL